MLDDPGRMPAGPADEVDPMWGAPISEDLGSLPLAPLLGSRDNPQKRRFFARAERRLRTRICSGRFAGCFDPAAQDDIIQNALLAFVDLQLAEAGKTSPSAKKVAKLAELRTEDGLLEYLVGIVHNKALDALRKRGRDRRRREALEAQVDGEDSSTCEVAPEPCPRDLALAQDVPTIPGLLGKSNDFVRLALKHDPAISAKQAGQRLGLSNRSAVGWKKIVPASLKRRVEGLDPEQRETLELRLTLATRYETALELPLFCTERARSK